MAKEDAKEPPKGKKKKSNKLVVYLFVVGMCIATPFMMPTVMLLAAGLIPTYVAFATDNDPQKSGAISVSAMNLAGLTPFLIDLWTKGQTMNNAFRILTESNSWLIILGAAAIGQLIVYTIPPAITILTLSHAESRIKLLRRNLDMLKEAWGPEVATTKSVDKIIQ